MLASQTRGERVGNFRSEVASHLSPLDRKEITSDHDQAPVDCAPPFPRPAALALLVTACGSSKSSSSSNTTTPGSPSSSSSTKLSGTLNGSGSTFQTVYQQSAIAAFKSVQPSMTVNYGSGGSGKGRTDLASGVVNYAGSDSPIPASDLSTFKGTVLYFPVVIGPITMSYNLSGVSDLKLDAADHREDLRGPDHHVERPRDHGPEPRRQPSEHQDHRRPSFGFVRHDSELFELPGQGRSRRVDARHLVHDQLAGHHRGR